MRPMRQKAVAATPIHRNRPPGGRRRAGVMNILIFVETTMGAQRRSGVQRVVMEATVAFAAIATVRLVRWDDWEGQLRHLGAEEIAALFRGAPPPGIVAHPMSQRAWYRFDETLDDPADTWLWFPEIAYHRADGDDVLARIVSQCREYGVRVATVCYDLIPITNPAYGDIAPPHLEYVCGLIRSDLILPISRHIGDVLTDHYRAALPDATPALEAALARMIQPAPLPEINRDARPTPPCDDEAGRDVIMMVGTVEPRKKQVDAIRAFLELRAESPAARALTVHVFGSLHGDVARTFRALLAQDDSVRYFDYVSDDTIQRSYDRALFSVFASNDEGFGLPITESLARGVPCLCAGFGSMGEIAEGGGCHTVDVNDQAALREGLRRMIEEPALRADLREGVRNRALRRWEDYAADTIALMRRFDADATAARDALAGDVEAALRTARQGAPAAPPTAAGVRVDARPADGGVALTVTVGRAAWLPPAAAGPEAGTPHGREDAPATLAAALVTDADAAPARDGFCDADIWAVATDAAAAQLRAAVRKRGAAAILPFRIVAAQDADARAAALAARVAADVALERRRYAFAQQERAYAALMAGAQAQDRLPPRPTPLAVVISTYNRGPFVEANVAHLLTVIAERALPVRVVVVDNASTDDSVARLARFRDNPAFELRVNPANVGMLGNLRVCSALRVARHVWVTGDDDFIDPETLARMARLVADNPGLPLAFVNFGVYHRQQLGPGDDVGRLMAERTPLAPKPDRTGMTPVTRAAQQHDNLFTAVYPIVWRSDLLAACFNYPFDGVPFDDLVECVPTTKFLLETARRFDAYWSAPIGIVGNAHNSWSSHRPRWHGLLMPLVFELALDAGLPRPLLAKWSAVHARLFDESVAETISAGRAIHLETPADLAPAERLFAAPLTVPPEALRHDPHVPARPDLTLRE